jgi:hypothetical protein
MVWRKYGGTPPHVEELLRAQAEMNVVPRRRQRGPARSD